MRFRYAGTTVDLKLASAKAWAFCSVMLFVFSTVYFLSQIRHGRTGRTNDVQEHLANLEPAKEDGNMPLKFNPLEKPKGYRFDNELEDVKMVMHSARGSYVEVMKKQRQILLAQVRPPDTHYNINITLSDTISMDRQIMDTRPPICKTFNYNSADLGTASVIIPFYNEALSMLLRTVHSVLNTSPDHLLHEVILVDDCSTRDYLKDSFTEYMKLLPKVRIIRNTGREGLIKSRLIGSRSTEARVVIFLDAHAETNVGWLEPLLDELLRHPASVIQPFVDGIEAMTIEYSAPPSLHKGTFSWDLGYRWQKLSDHEAARSIETGYPFFSPTLVGCAIAVNKKYFEHIGEFDEGLKVWGGENIELGFRAWMCGGRIVTVICSRVGHVFKNFPYKFDGNREQIVSKNLMRVTETWMDGFRKYYYATARLYDFKRTEFDQEDLASLAERIELRKRLKCENFEWYMHNIVPDVEVPPMDASYYGELASIKTKACWELTADYYVGMNYLCYEHKIIPRNYFHINHLGQLKYRDKCIRIEPPQPALRLGECPEVSPEDLIQHGIWEMESFGQTWGMLKVKIKNRDGNIETFCVIQVTNVFVRNHNKEQMPQITKCDRNNEFQMWAWTYKFAWEQVPKRLLTNNGIGKNDHFIQS